MHLPGGACRHARQRAGQAAMCAVVTRPFSMLVISQPFSDRVVLELASGGARPDRLKLPKALGLPQSEEYPATKPMSIPVGREASTRDGSLVWHDREVDTPVVVEIRSGQVGPA